MVIQGGIVHYSIKIISLAVVATRIDSASRHLLEPYFSLRFLSFSTCSSAPESLRNLQKCATQKELQIFQRSQPEGGGEAEEREGPRRGRLRGKWESERLRMWRSRRERSKRNCVSLRRYPSGFSSLDSPSSPPSRSASRCRISRQDAA